MKVAFVNTFESSGGAAIAANRLMKALRKEGIEISYIVRDKSGNNLNVVSVNSSFFKKKLNFIRFAWERLCIFICNKFDKKNLFAVSIANTGNNITKLDAIKEADIIHLHWINQGFLSLKNIEQLIETGKPVIWTMHDMWTCTGICHYSWGCTHFHNECGNCKFLNKPAQNDCSHKVWKKKSRIKLSRIKPVGVSNWLAKQISASSLFRNAAVRIIPNVIDTEIFAPKNKDTIKQQFGIPDNKKIILFSAAKVDDSIKGFNFFCSALNLLYEQENCAESIYVVIIGRIKNDINILSGIKFPYKYFGAVNDIHTTSLIFAMSDVVVNSSYYETFGQTIIEAMSSGSIPVAFNNSGITDIIDHKQNGYLAEHKSAEDLAKGIYWVLYESDYKQLSLAARKKVIATYSEETVAKQYMKLYSDILTIK